MHVISGEGEGQDQDSLLMGQYGQLGKVVDLFNGKKNGFLADHNSSIGDLVTD